MCLTFHLVSAVCHEWAHEKFITQLKKIFCMIVHKCVVPFMSREEYMGVVMSYTCERGIRTRTRQNLFVIFLLHIRNLDGWSVSSLELHI